MAKIQIFGCKLRENLQFGEMSAKKLLNDLGVYSRSSAVGLFDRLYLQSGYGIVEMTGRIRLPFYTQEHPGIGLCSVLNINVYSSLCTVDNSSELHCN